MTIVEVSPTEKNPSHHISIDDSADGGSVKYGLYIKRGVRGIREYPFSPSSLKIQQGRQGYGSFEPPYTSIDQVDFSGGRGQLRFEDPTKFYDSYNMWTMTPGLLMPAPLWRFARGLRDEHTWMPGDTFSAGGTQNTTLEWVELTGDQEYVAAKLTTVAAYDMENIWLLLKYKGAPGTLTVHIYDDNSNPNASQGSVGLYTAHRTNAIPEGSLVGQLVCFNFATPISLSATTDYWVVVQAASADDTDDHYEIAMGNNGTFPSRGESSNGSSWNTLSRAMYYRVTDVNIDQEIHWQEYKRALYACTEPLDGGPGKIYLNGDRGVFTAGGSYSSLEQIAAEDEQGVTDPDSIDGAFLAAVNYFRYDWTPEGHTNKFAFCWSLFYPESLAPEAHKLHVVVENMSGKQAKIGFANSDGSFAISYTPQFASAISPVTLNVGSTVDMESGSAVNDPADTGYFAFSCEENGQSGGGCILRINRIYWLKTSGAVVIDVWNRTDERTGISDSTKSWTVNEWAGAYCHIWNGTGEGQYRKIISNTADTLTVDPAWDEELTPGGTDVGSEYVIIGTNKWQDVTPTLLSDGTGITAPITGTLTLWGVLYLAQGEKDYILRVREYNNSGTWTPFWTTSAAAATVAYDGTNNALFLNKTYDPVNENFIWRTRNENPAEFSTVDKQTSVSKADDVVWGTDLSFGNPIPVGTPDFLINGTAIYNNKLWVGKEDSLWYIDWDGSRDRAYPIQVGLDAITSPENCKAMVAQNLYLFFNWAQSIERYYGGTMDDVGPWKGQGLIKRAQGYVSDLQAAIGWMFGSVDGGDDRQSSVTAMTHGWHTLFRAPSITQDDFDGDQKNPRIRSMQWQSVQGKDATNYLWFEMGGDIMSMPMPRNSLNPALDDAMMFAPESYIVQSRMDAMFPEQEKYFDKVRISSPAVTGTIYADYVVDPGIDDPAFTNAGSGTSGPSIESDIWESRIRRIMNRIRISPSGLSDTTQNTVEASVTDAVARMPVKEQWDLKLRVKDKAKTLTALPDHDPDTLVTQLKTWSKQAKVLTMNSVLTQMHGKRIFIEPPSALRDFWNRVTTFWGGTITITVREA